MASQISRKVEYSRLVENEEGREVSEPVSKPVSFLQRPAYSLHLIIIGLALVLTSGAGFFAGVLWTQNALNINNYSSSTAPKIPLPYTQTEFVYSSPFSLAPPQGEGSGDESEPIWDDLVPNGLGYFRDGKIAPKVSIPTTFHQLHCLYILRRAYYSTRSDSQLESFDLGKNRTIHAAHCFDYLKQTITCSVDSTVEPYEDDDNTDGFLGSGFLRQCRSFDALKQYVEKWRVFNATGFLAAGIAHGKAHVHGSEGQ
ncbi:hypothetical protein B0I35DRAFT_425006 [Stachybotrys elegans]|uniref:Uncharacterized protein n=1 Tax=Stachybotrys elegans TaxID=80388 RepID=A0A8K0WV88_9HYPO|nr:hypothetical protein B0I35DRAFT_425006 [Stachybotrys elegans]